MARRVAQFRFFGDANTAFNSVDKTAIYHQMDDNQPNSLTTTDLISGEVFDNYTPIIQLGIQSQPGLKFNLNTNLDPVVVGASGMYELDLTESSAVLTSLTFEKESLDLINMNPDGFLIIDIVYQEE